MYLDPTTTFFWYALAIAVLCLGVCLLADLSVKRQERRERWEARDLTRLARLSDPARVSGKRMEGDRSSAA
jgi:heme exporter protein D